MSLQTGKKIKCCNNVIASTIKGDINNYVFLEDPTDVSVFHHILSVKPDVFFGECPYDTSILFCFLHLVGLMSHIIVDW